jgi:sensor histidine kinase YesM
MTELKKGYKEFYKIQVNMNKLYNKNILSASYMTKSAFPYIKPITLSESLVSILIDLFDTNEINYSLLKTISDAERDFFTIFMDKSGATPALKYRPINVTDTILVDRFTLLQSAIVAGNDLDEVVNELIDIIRKLVKINKISREDAKELISEIM